MPMRLIDLIAPRSLCVPLPVADRREAFTALVDDVSESEEQTKMLVDLLERREDQASTLICPDLAFPHARVPDWTEFHLAVGVIPEGIPFGSGTARVLFLLLTSANKNNLILQVRAALAKAFFADPTLLPNLIAADTGKRARQLLAPITVEAKKPLTASDIMIAPAPSVPVSASIHQVLGSLRENNLTELAVVGADDELLGSVGIDEITGLGIPEYFDLMGDLSFIPDYEPFVEVFQVEHSETIEALYTREVSIVPPDAHVVSLAQLFKKNKVRYIYVVDEARLVGICTRRQLLRSVLMP